MNQPELPLPPTTDDLCRQAMERLAHWIARSAGQHQRRINEAFERARIRLGVV